MNEYTVGSGGDRHNLLSYYRQKRIVTLNHTTGTDNARWRCHLRLCAWDGQQEQERQHDQRKYPGGDTVATAALWARAVGCGWVVKDATGGALGEAHTYLARITVISYHNNLTCILNMADEINRRLEKLEKFMSELQAQNG